MHILEDNLHPTWANTNCSVFSAKTLMITSMTPDYGVSQIAKELFYRRVSGPNTTISG